MRHTGSDVLRIDNAKYETVVKTLDLLRKTGFSNKCSLEKGRESWPSLACTSGEVAAPGSPNSLPDARERRSAIDHRLTFTGHYVPGIITVVR